MKIHLEVSYHDAIEYAFQLYADGRKEECNEVLKLVEDEVVNTSFRYENLINQVQGLQEELQSCYNTIDDLNTQIKRLENEDVEGSEQESEPVRPKNSELDHTGGEG
jgi:uncharacterized coiled-coil DUF342 family protein